VNGRGGGEILIARSGFAAQQALRHTQRLAAERGYGADEEGSKSARRWSWSSNDSITVRQGHLAASGAPWQWR